MIERLFGNQGMRRQGSRKNSRPKSPSSRLRLELLEDRTLLATTPAVPPGLPPTPAPVAVSVQKLQTLAINGQSADTQQSKVWQYNGNWWMVMADSGDAAVSGSGGTFLWRLDGKSWTKGLKLNFKKYKADVKVVGNLAHVLLFGQDEGKLVSLEYVAAAAGSPATYQPWTQHPKTTVIPLAPPPVVTSTGTTPLVVTSATIDVDCNGRMWLASDGFNDIEVRYSDAPYTTFSDPILVAPNVAPKDVTLVTALPNCNMGVLWTNHIAQRFGFRTHDGQNPDPTIWSADELPAAQSAQKSGSGMAGTNLNVKVASDGTLYAAVGTGYAAIDPSLPQVALLVRRPSGAWDPLYSVDPVGMHPIVLLNETLGHVMVAYTGVNVGTSGEVAYRESPTSAIAFTPRKTLFAGLHDDLTSTKQNWSDAVVVLASVRINPPPSTTPPDPTVLPIPAVGEVVTAMVSSNPNKPPTVDAGADQTVPVSQSAKLPGNVKDDGLPKLPGKVTTRWSRVSGPGTVTFASASSANTTVSFGSVGTYVLRLQAGDGELTASDDVQITVTAPPPNQAPVVNAGLDQSLQGSSTTVLQGTARDDGQPIPPGNLSTNWWQVSGPGTVTIASASSTKTNVTFSSPGVYVLRFEANDGALTASDDVQITVAAGPPNQAPVVNAGPDQKLLGATMTVLQGSARDDGQPKPPGKVTTKWTQVSGPGTVTFANASSTNTSAAFSSPGAYVLRLEANDGALTASDDVAITITAITNLAPQVNAGPDQTVLSTATVTLPGKVTDDGFPKPPGKVKTAWTMVSGPGKVTFKDFTVANTLAKFSVPGIYVLRLTADDGLLKAVDDVMITVK